MKTCKRLHRSHLAPLRSDRKGVRYMELMGDGGRGFCCAEKQPGTNQLSQDALGQEQSGAIVV